MHCIEAHSIGKWCALNISKWDTQALSISIWDVLYRAFNMSTNTLNCTLLSASRTCRPGPLYDTHVPNMVH